VAAGLGFRQGQAPVLTEGTGFPLGSGLSRFAPVRKRQYRARSPFSKPLVMASIETFDQFVDDLEPLPSLNFDGACRAAFVTSSYTIIPSRQHRSVGSRKGETVSTGSSFMPSSFDRLIERQRFSRYDAASICVSFSGICNARSSSA
jgi:hypothetical protein